MYWPIGHHHRFLHCWIYHTGPWRAERSYLVETPYLVVSCGLISFLQNISEFEILGKFNSHNKNTAGHFFSVHTLTHIWHASLFCVVPFLRYFIENLRKKRKKFHVICHSLAKKDVTKMSRCIFVVRIELT